MNSRSQSKKKFCWRKIFFLMCFSIRDRLSFKAKITPTFPGGEIYPQNLKKTPGTFEIFRCFQSFLVSLVMFSTQYVSFFLKRNLILNKGNIGGLFSTLIFNRLHCVGQLQGILTSLRQKQYFFKGKYPVYDVETELRCDFSQNQWVK